MNIPSILETHPGLPAIMGAINLNQSIAAGDVIVHQNLVHARAVVKALEATKGNILSLDSLELSKMPVLPLCTESGNDPLVTNKVVETARLRVTAMEVACKFLFYFC
jgi:hypothetical protein